MKFFFAKSTHICLYCRSEINQGEPFGRLTINNRQGGKMGLIFHPWCFSKWSEEKFNQRYLNWERQQIPPRKRGRPRKYKDSEKANRLKSLLTYHKKAGNIGRVGGIERELKELEVKE